MTNETGKTDFTFSRDFLISEVANSLRNSGRTCDEDSWSEVMAREALSCLWRLGALK